MTNRAIEKVEFEMTGYQGLDKETRKARNHMKRVAATHRQGGLVLRGEPCRSLLESIERIRGFATQYDRRHLKGEQKSNQKFEDARQLALDTVWRVFHWLHVDIDASALGEMSEESHADVFLTSVGQKNPNRDFDQLPDPSPYASEVEIASLEELKEKFGKDDEEWDLEDIMADEFQAAPADGFEGDDVQGFWRDPREPKWSGLSS